MALSGLGLALDLSRTEFSINKTNRNWQSNCKISPTTLSTKLTSNYDVGIQYIPGELGGYQAVLKKDTTHFFSVAMFALSSSESERSLSRCSDTSGISSMTSGSYVEAASLKLKYQNIEIGPVTHETRNILDVGNNMKGGSSFFYPSVSDDIMKPKDDGSQNRPQEIDCRINSTTNCPDCGFETAYDFVPNSVSCF